jgi:hypothetical protein
VDFKTLGLSNQSEAEVALTVEDSIVSIVRVVSTMRAVPVMREVSLAVMVFDLSAVIVI